MTPIPSVEVPVRLTHDPYSIRVGAEVLQSIPEGIRQYELEGRHAIVITDENVNAHYGQPVVDLLKQVSNRVDLISVEPGEKSKSIEKAACLWERVLELNADRSSYIVALGGGVVGDLAGFVAATYMRGIPFVQIPTSLLALVDSSIGGKTGINLPGGKNMVGCFHQPKWVVADISTLKTLDEANFRAGMAEVIKYGMIMDAPFFEFLESNVDQINRRDESTMTEMIAWCCRCKAEVVVADEKETLGRRAILNYGHTFGHAIEKVFGYGQYLHGEAIGIGMRCAARLAKRMGRISDSVVQRQSRLLDAVFLDHPCPQDQRNLLIAAMEKTKNRPDPNLD